MLSDLFLTGVRLREPPPRESWLSRVPAVRSLARSPLTLTKSVTFLVGENGMGKSTLLEGIAVALGFNPEGGTENFRFSTRESHSPLHQYLTVSRGVRIRRGGYFLRAESFYNAASYIDQTLDNRGYGDRSLHDMSHGESFLTLVENRFGPDSLYLLDEPESALSPMRQLTLLCHLQALTARGCQFVISTHSPLLITLPGAEVLELRPEGIQSVPYAETEHYRLTRRFLDAPEATLRHLLD